MKKQTLEERFKDEFPMLRGYGLKETEELPEERFCDREVLEFIHQEIHRAFDSVGLERITPVRYESDKGHNKAAQTVARQKEEFIKSN